MIQNGLKRLPFDDYGYTLAVRKVRPSLDSRFRLEFEQGCFRFPRLGFPLLHPPFYGSELVGLRARLLLLQACKQREGSEAGFASSHREQRCFPIPL